MDEIKQYRELRIPYWQKCFISGVKLEERCSVNYCVMVLKAEIIWNVDGTVVAVSQRSRHGTDVNNGHVYKNDEGTR
jgi:hypothetical protein